MDLAEIRIKLDEIDKQIENLFEERMRLCGEAVSYTHLTLPTILLV